MAPAAAAAAAAAVNSSAVICQGHTRPVVDIRFARLAEGLEVFITACHDKSAHVRWADSGNWIGSLIGHQGAVWSATIDGPGVRAATASADFTAKVWDLSTGTELASLQHAHVVKSVDFGVAADRLLTCGLEKSAFVFDLATNERVTAIPHDSAVLHALWNGTMIATAGADGKVRKWDCRQSPARAAAEFVSPGPKTTAGVTDLEYRSDLGVLVAAVGKKVFVLNADSLAVQRELSTGTVDANAASLSPSGRHLAVGGQDLCAHLLEVESGNVVNVFKGHSGPLFACRWQNASRFATASEDSLVRIWTAEL